MQQQYGAAYATLDMLYCCSTVTAVVTPRERWMPQDGPLAFRRLGLLPWDFPFGVGKRLHALALALLQHCCSGSSCLLRLLYWVIVESLAQCPYVLPNTIRQHALDLWEASHSYSRNITAAACYLQLIKLDTMVGGNASISSSCFAASLLCSSKAPAL